MTLTTHTDEGPSGRGADRKRKILGAAAELVAARGYHEVGMSDIGAAAGVTGSAIYRHFDGKSAVLVALFDRALDNLTREASEIVEAPGEPIDILRGLIASQVGFTLHQRTLAQVYYTEIHNLPDEDSHRLRRKQRLYIEEWVHVLGLLRPNDSDGTLRARVHAAIGAIQSVLDYQSGLPPEELGELMASIAESLICTPDSN
ncbi:MAG: TetR/AcrR family transcriptional regulator [Solirubrobacterales bacterium]